MIMNVFSLCEFFAIFCRKIGHAGIFPVTGITGKFLVVLLQTAILQQHLQRSK